MACSANHNMAIFNIDLDLDQTQPRNEPKYSRPRKSAQRRSKSVTNTISSPRIVLDVELSITSRASIAYKEGKSESIGENFRNDLDVQSQTKQEVLLVGNEREEVELFSVSKLSKPVWPKSTPTIPSSIFKDEFGTEVNIYLLAISQNNCLILCKVFM